MGYTARSGLTQNHKPFHLNILELKPKKKKKKTGKALKKHTGKGKKNKKNNLI